jgi:hypothetical protein
MTWRLVPRRWRRRSRQKRSRANELREFVYLDEISVYSLLASRSGPVATDFTETETNSLRGEASGGVTLGAGLAKAETQALVEASQGTSSQVVRKSSAQTRFKQLLDDEQEALILRATPRGDVPHIEAGQQPGNIPPMAATDWVLDHELLQRGRLVEIEVELEADEVYKVSETVAAILEIVERDPDLFGISHGAGLREGVALSRLLEQLLVGLVPIRARAAHYRVVPNFGRPLVVHERVLEGLSEPPCSEPLYVVGVADAGLFWKDVRRILFAGNQYLAMCRIAHDGLITDWSPIKLADVLATVSPDIAAQLGDVGRGLLPALQGATTPDEGKAVGHHKLNATIISYAAELAAAYETTVTESELWTAQLLVPPTIPLPTTTEQRRQVFKPVTTFVGEKAGTTVDPMLAAQMRGVAQMEAEAEPALTPASVSEDAPETVDFFLDVEFIALYW